MGIFKNKTLKILVVEDDQRLLKVVLKKLTMSGFEAVGARTASQAVELLEQLGKVDAIWLDHYLLGRTSGLDFVAYLKNENSKWATIPVFVVSNSGRSDNVQSYMRLGANEYFTKSDYRLDDIVRELKETIN